MQQYEYLALPAPRRGNKIKGLKTPAERFAHAVTALMNDVAAEGWEFWRTECLPSEERKGFTGTSVVENHLMIFRRLSAEALAEQVAATEPVYPAAPAPIAGPERRAEPMFLERPAGEAPVYDDRREPQFRNQSDETR